MADSSEPTCRGKIVALEGPSELISAQLRLLPISPQILILPSIQQYLTASGRPSPSTIKQLIYRIHMAAQTRHAAAMAFLRESPADQKRAVFLDGGTVGARFTCLSAISEQEAGGDFEKAELIYDSLVSKGVAGLSSLDQDVGKGIGEAASDVTAVDLRVGSHGEDDIEMFTQSGMPDRIQDRILRAMLAAEALDRRTENLQLPGDNADLSATWFNNSKTWSKRSLVLPSLGQPPVSPTSTNDIVDETRRLPYSISSNRSLFTLVEDLLAKKLQATATICERPLEANIPAASLSWVDEACDVQKQPTSPLKSPDSHGDHSTVTPTLPSPLRPIRSDIEDADSNSEPAPTMPKPPRRKRPPMLTLDTGRSNRQSDGHRGIRALNEALEAPHTPATTSQGQNVSNYPATYVDKATNTVDLGGGSNEQQTTYEQPFQQVLPVLEHLVIQLLGDASSPLFDRLFQGFRDGSRMTGARGLESMSSILELGGSLDRMECLDSDLVSSIRDNVDPVLLQAVHTQVMMPTSPGQPVNGRLPTPPYDSYSPATPRPGPDQRFQTVRVRKQTSVSAQTTLRLMLSSYIPSEVWTQFPSASTHPEDGTLWKPILWAVKANKASKLESSWRAGKGLDLILAIGAERTVKSGYASNIIRQVERLGYNSTGDSRTGRVLLKNLHAHVMQAHTSRRLVDQTLDSPFTDPTTLANLILPHLETYLSAHPDVRFLIIEFVVEHLPTVLALRRLIGSELFKVASIIGSDNPDLRLSMAQPRSHSEKYAYTELRNVGGLVDLNNPHRPREAYIPFTKANYTLSSTATHAEISGFISAIRSQLISTSDFYRPDIQRKPINNSLAHLRHNAFLSTSTMDTPPATPRDRFSTAPQSPLRPPSSATSSPTSVIPSVTESEDRVVRGVFLGSASQVDGVPGWVTTSTSSRSWRTKRGDDDDSEDSEERRLMPLYLRREAQKGDGKKALKWLGLE